jgi:methionyl-tRNA formyltransferase
MGQPLRIVFAGTPEFARVALARLTAEPPFRPIAVYTQPDRPAGRGMKLTPSPVKQLALAEGIPVRQPERLRDPAEQQALAALAPDVMVVAAYGLILPQPVLDTPRHGCLNIHASLLPRWRGAAPIHRALLVGDTETGVCIMQMEAGLDTGPVLAEARTPIGPEDTTGSLHDRLAALGAETLLGVLRAIADGRPPMPRPQPDQGVTYAQKITPDEARIDWSAPAAQIERMTRAFNPAPGAWTMWRGEKLKIWRARLDPPADPSAPPGTILALDAGGIRVATGSGSLRLTEVQRPGGRRMPVAAWLAGGGPRSGEVLGA